LKINTRKLNLEINTPANYKYRILHLSIHSLPDTFDKLKILMNNIDMKIDIILLCETFLNEENADNCEITGYNFVCKNRQRYLKMVS
jgi:hypothetical protein